MGLILITAEIQAKSRRIDGRDTASSYIDLRFI